MVELVADAVDGGGVVGEEVVRRGEEETVNDADVVDTDGKQICGRGEWEHGPDGRVEVAQACDECGGAERMRPDVDGLVVAGLEG